MKFKYIGEEKIEIGMLGIVKPGQEFDIENELYLPIFVGNPRFEEIEDEKPIKKEEVKEEE